MHKHPEGAGGLLELARRRVAELEPGPVCRSQGLPAPPTVLAPSVRLWFSYLFPYLCKSYRLRLQPSSWTPATESLPFRDLPQQGSVPGVPLTGPPLRPGAPSSNRSVGVKAGRMLEISAEAEGGERGWWAPHPPPTHSSLALLARGLCCLTARRELGHRTGHFLKIVIKYIYHMKFTIFTFFRCPGLWH